MNNSKGVNKMDSRNFQLHTEWNMIHYPEKPSGFGILIIGDERHFVDEKQSFWTQNEGKSSLISALRRDGYTIFYSNLYGRNWGSRKAIEMAKRLYAHTIRHEIINERIHIIAEGMGALVASALMNEMNENIRSMTFINPIFSLKTHLEQEKEHKFFYKKLKKEVEAALVSNIKEIDESIAINEEQFLQVDLPVKIIHILSSSRAYKQSHHLKELSVKWSENNQQVSINYLLPEKRHSLSNHIIRFLNENEAIL